MPQPSFLSHNNMKAAATHYYWFYHQTQSDVKNGKLQLWSSLAHSIFVPDEMIFIHNENLTKGQWKKPPKLRECIEKCLL